MLVNYNVTIDNGNDNMGKEVEKTPIINTYERQIPVSFKIGDEKLIDCINNGLLDFHVGASLQISCPSMMAYKSKTVAKIPSFSNLFIRIDILDITPGDRTEDEAEDLS